MTVATLINNNDGATKLSGGSLDAETAAVAAAAAAYSNYKQQPAAATVAIAAAVQEQQQQQQQQSALTQYYDVSSANLGFMPVGSAIQNHQQQTTPSAVSVDGGMLINVNGLYYPASALTGVPYSTNGVSSASSASTAVTSRASFYHQQHHQQQQQQRQQSQQLLQQQLILQQQQQMLLSAAAGMAPLGVSSPNNAFNADSFAVPKLPAEQLAATPAASFEGVPIFIVPQSGTLSLNALQRANEFKLAQLAGSFVSTPKIDTSKHFHVFVGDLSSEVDNKMLKEAFDKCGHISEAKVIRDPQSLKSRGYGFVSFPDKKDAQRAIDKMNGVMVGRRVVRTNWASRRAAASSATGSVTGGASEDEKAPMGDDGSGGGKDAQHAAASNDDSGNSNEALERLMAAVDAENTTVYVGNLSADDENGTDTDKEKELREAFNRFGEIKEVRLFLAQNYGFVIYDKKRSAAHAILNMNGAELRAGAGRRLRCSWGRAGLGAIGGNNASATQHDVNNLNALATAQMIAAQYAVSQNNQSVAAQNANAILAAQISAVNQQQQQQIAAAAASAATYTATPTQSVASSLLPYYAMSGATALDAMTLNAATSMAANTLYIAQQPGGAWHA